MRAIYSQILSSFFFSLLGLQIKISSANLNIETIIFYRCLIGFIVSYLLILFFSQKNKYLVTHNFKNQILRAVCGTLAMFFGYKALKFITLAQASTISFTKIFFVFLLATVFLKEKLSAAKISLSIVGFSGVFLISSSKLPEANLGISMALLGSFFVAMGIVLMSYMSKKDETLTIIFYHSFFSCLMIGIIFFKKITFVSVENFILLLSISLTALLAQYFNTESYKKNNANFIILFGYSRIIFSILFGYFFLNELISVNQFIGLIIIIITTLTATKVKEK